MDGDASCTIDEEDRTINNGKISEEEAAEDGGTNTNVPESEDSRITRQHQPSSLLPLPSRRHSYGVQPGQSPSALPSRRHSSILQPIGIPASLGPQSHSERSLLPSSSSGIYSNSWTNTVGPSPYTIDNRPKRRPFHPTVAGARGSISSLVRVGDDHDIDTHLYTRYRYYSRLRAPVDASDLALVIPDHVVPNELFLPYIPGQKRDADGKQSSVITIIAIWNTMMGTSLMTMPWAFGQAGFLGGILIMLLMAALALYTAIRLLSLQKIMAIEGPTVELSRLCRQLFGGVFGKITEGLSVSFSVLTLVGAQVVYWVLMSNFLFNTGEIIHDAVNSDLINGSSSALRCPPNETRSPEELLVADPSVFHRWWKQDLTVPLYLIVPFIFILNLRDAKIFTYFNSLGAISVLVMYLFVITKAIIWGINLNFTDPSSDFYTPLFKNTFMCLTGTLSLAYFIHNCVVTIMQGNRHQENNVRDLSIAYVLVALTYIPIGVIFYSTFPLPKFCVVDNFLDNFPPHDIVLAVVRGFLFFQILTVYPLLGFFIRNQLFTYFMGPNYEYQLWRVVALNVCLVSLSVLVAIFYPNIGFIIRWVGAISGLAYIFLLPCVTYMYAMYAYRTLHWYHVVIHGLIILLGIGNFVSQFFIA